MSVWIKNIVNFHQMPISTGVSLNSAVEKHIYYTFILWKCLTVAQFYTSMSQALLTRQVTNDEWCCHPLVNEAWTVYSWPMLLAKTRHGFKFLESDYLPTIFFWRGTIFVLLATILITIKTLHKIIVEYNVCHNLVFENSEVRIIIS